MTHADGLEAQCLTSEMEVVTQNIAQTLPKSFLACLGFKSQVPVNVVLHDHEGQINVYLIWGLE